MYAFSGPNLVVRNMSAEIGQAIPARRGPNLDLKRTILDRMRHEKSVEVWTPNDFLGARLAVRKALQRLAISGGSGV
jgi:hypothetical protein